ncbi:MULTISPECIES: hypothetical protein [unclassified Streptomyces]|uniref:L,D-transpeptidase n=1 Tax=Streptomyces evansiae TaxID=3075535 RepID=A0ABU2QXJ3_9ACTN|nr:MULTISPECIES: hypothetical protein [unclassified Streptomyces]MDT0409167.1 hypothetical protein [Streptomyces sp. DSM 41979]
MAGRSSGIVAGLTAAALAGIGFLAFQANASAPEHLAKAPHSPSASPSPSADPNGSGGHGKKGSGGKEAAAAVPAGSGEGKRVVYALGAKRVWLVDESGKASATFEVTPSTVDPAPGTYSVTSRAAAVLGSDGVRIVKVVRFAVTGGVVVGFSAAADGSTPQPDPGSRTGGVRESLKDADTMWDFADLGSKVVVVK